MRRLVILISFLIFCCPAFSGDLYLLNIESKSQLENVVKIVDYAHGVLDSKFLVDLNSSQVNRLQLYGINLELLVKDCQLEDTYLLVEDHKEISRSVISLKPLYSTAKRYLVELEKSSIDIVAREGFMELRLSERETPFFYNPPLYPTSALFDYPTDSLADMINIDSLYSYDTRLEAFWTRFTPTDSNMSARYWIRNKFLSFGYTDISFQYFLSTREWMEVYNEPAWNVICVKEGNGKADEWIIIGGHYDSFAYGSTANPYYHSPGADDNASGTSAVLELSRIFKDYDFQRSIMFVAFGAEEEGLDGAYHLAEQLEEDSVNVKLMLNYDVIAYEGDAIPDFGITTIRQKAFSQVFIDAVPRLNDLVTVTSNSALSSDDAAFNDYGFQTVACYEHEFHPDMHSSYDNSASIDFELMRKIIQLGATSVPIIDASPEPVVPYAMDAGDGQSLRVMWDSCYDDYSYKIVYGASSYSMNDTIAVPALECHMDVTGLTEGSEYTITVMGEPLDGLPPIGYILTTGTPYLAPRMPANLNAELDSASIVLGWEMNTELDFSHYKILRRIPSEAWTVLVDDLTDNFFTDTDPIKYSWNFYVVLAYDGDGYESDTTNAVSAIPATFDPGILLIDETQGDGINPTENEQLIFYDNMFDTLDYDMLKIDSADQALTTSEAGQYDKIFWVDDDDYNHVLENSIDSLSWYFGYQTDFLLAGWSTIYAITGNRYFYPGSFYYDEIGISYIAQNPTPDFIGPEAVVGWPVLELKPDSPYGGRLPDIDIFTAADGAEVIYTYDSYSPNSPYNGKPVGIAYDTHEGKRVILGFPLYWLTEASAQALIVRVMEYFAEESIHPSGDANNDWSVNLLDITFLISYLYMGEPSPEDLNNGDPNGDCGINILDITYLISYLYKGGPMPEEGCIIK